MKSRHVYVGIDPGKKGAIAFFIPDQDVLIMHDWPSSNSEDDIFSFISGYLDYLYKHSRNVKHCVIEKVSAMPKQGVVSMFNFGMNYGIWRSIASFYKWKRTFLTPQTWRKGLVTPSDGKDSTKQANYNVALRLFPKCKALFVGARGAIKDGRVDAALMAYKAWQMDKQE